MRVGGWVYTAWLKNSSTTPGAALGVWDDMLQTQPLSPAYTQKYMGPTVHTLTYCLLSSSKKMLVTYNGGYFLIGVKIQQPVMRNKNLISYECKA